MLLNVETWPSCSKFWFGFTLSSCLFLNDSPSLSYIRQLFKNRLGLDYQEYNSVAHVVIFQELNVNINWSQKSSASGQPDSQMSKTKRLCFSQIKGHLSEWKCFVWSCKSNPCIHLFIIFFACWGKGIKKPAIFFFIMVYIYVLYLHLERVVG